MMKLGIFLDISQALVKNTFTNLHRCFFCAEINNLQQFHTINHSAHFFVSSLRDTMFYVCQGSCLCGTVNNRGKVIYCYGDLVPRHGELFAEGSDPQGGTSSKDLLAAQLGIWTFGIIAL